MNKKAFGLIAALVVLFTLLCGCVEKSGQKTGFADVTFTLSDKTTIADKEQRREKMLYWWPDGNYGVLKNGSEYTFYASNGGSIAKTQGDLDNPAKKVSYPSKQITGHDYDYLAGGPVFEYGGMIYLIYHFEEYRGNENTEFYSGLGMACSKNGGETFEDLGSIITPNMPMDDPACPASFDIGGGSFLQDNDNVYVYFRDMMKTGTATRLAVARASKKDIEAAAALMQAPVFQKYSQGSFTQPGLGGTADDLGGQTGNLRWFDVSYNSFLNEYLMVYVQDTPDGAANLFLTRSLDKINWQKGTQLTFERDECYYPSIIAMGSNTQTTEKEFYVYFTQSISSGFQRWTHANLMRVKVTVDYRA